MVAWADHSWPSVKCYAHTEYVYNMPNLYCSIVLQQNSIFNAYFTTRWIAEQVEIDSFGKINWIIDQLYIFKKTFVTRNLKSLPICFFTCSRIFTQTRLHRSYLLFMIPEWHSFFTMIMLSTDYGHRMARSLILCGSNSKPNPKWTFGMWI